MNVGDKTRNVSFRVNDKMYLWLLKQQKEMKSRTLGDFMRTLVRTGMYMDEHKDSVVEDLVKIYTEENNKN